MNLLLSLGLLLFDRSPDWSPPWEYYSQLQTGLAAAGCAENDHSRFKDAFPMHKAPVLSQPARSRAHKPHHLHACIFNHCRLMSCTNLIMWKVILYSTRSSLEFEKDRVFSVKTRLKQNWLPSELLMISLVRVVVVNHTGTHKPGCFLY